MYKIQPNGLYFVTLTVVGGIDVFTRCEYCDLLVDNLNYCIDNKRLRVYEYAIMPSQLYMIADVEEGKSNLPKVWFRRSRRHGRILTQPHRHRQIPVQRRKKDHAQLRQAKDRGIAGNLLLCGNFLRVGMKREGIMQ